MALLIGGLAVGVYAGRSRARLVLAAGLLALAFLAEQNGLLVGAAWSSCSSSMRADRAVWFGLPYLASCLAPVLALNAASSGWLLYHIFVIGSAEEVLISRAVHFLLFELLGVMLAISLAAGLALALEWRQSGWRFWRVQPWLLGIALAVGISLVGRSSVGGDLNNRMPAYALLCLAPALAARHLLAADPARWGRWAAWVVAALFGLQFALGVYNPLRYIPTAAMRARPGDGLIATPLRRASPGRCW